MLESCFLYPTFQINSLVYYVFLFVLDLHISTGLQCADDSHWICCGRRREKCSHPVSTVPDTDRMFNDLMTSSPYISGLPLSKVEVTVPTNILLRIFLEIKPCYSM